MAVRYRPVGGGIVGGDFYDIFPVGPGPAGTPRWGLLVGDVAGKGVEAAAMTALVRYTGRAAARDDASPAAVLAKCNDAVLASETGEDTEGERFVTMISAVVEPGRSPGGPAGGVRFACGGHPLPVLRAADGSVADVGVPGTAMGLLPEPSLTEVEVALQPGDTLALFTDGLLEARSPAGDFAPQLLDQALRASAGSDAEATARAALAAVDAFERGRPRDDLVLVVLGIAGTPSGCRSSCATCPPCCSCSCTSTSTSCCGSSSWCGWGRGRAVRTSPIPSACWCWWRTC